jgi:hypothetical protein
MNKLHRNEFVGTAVPDFYPTKDTTATAVVINPASASAAAITGRALGHKLRDTTVAQRAAIAAEDMDGNITITKPTIGQVALLYGISRSTLNTARALGVEQRDRVAKGQRPLATRRDRVKASVYSDQDIAFFVDMVGFDRVFNIMDMLTRPKAEAAE